MEQYQSVAAIAINILRKVVQIKMNNNITEKEQRTRKARHCPRGPRTDEAAAGHATLLMHGGLYSKAAQAREQSPVAPATLATHTSRRAL